MTTAISAGQRRTPCGRTRRPRRRASPPPRPALLPSCGTGAPISHAGSPPRLAEREGDHRRGRSLAVRAADDDRAPQLDELGEELRPPQARARPGRPTRRPPPSRPGTDGLGRDLDLDALERRRGTASRPGPSRRPRPPRRARAARRPERPAPPIPTNQSRRPLSSAAGKRDQPLGDLLGRVRLGDAEHRLPHPLEAAPDRRAASERGPGRRRGRGRGPSSRRPPDEVLGVLRLVVGGRERVRARGSPACPRPRSPRPSCRRARARGRRPSTRRRSGRSTGSAGSRRASSAALQRPVVALAGDVEDGRPDLAERLDRESR